MVHDTLFANKENKICCRFGFRLLHCDNCNLLVLQAYHKTSFTYFDQAYDSSEISKRLRTQVKWSILATQEALKGANIESLVEMGRSCYPDQSLRTCKYLDWNRRVLAFISLTKEGRTWRFLHRRAQCNQRRKKFLNEVYRRSLEIHRLSKWQWRKRRGFWLLNDSRWCSAGRTVS